MLHVDDEGVVAKDEAKDEARAVARVAVAEAARSVLPSKQTLALLRVLLLLHLKPLLLHPKLLPRLVRLRSTCRIAF